MNDVTPPGRLPSPRVPQRPVKGVRPIVPVAPRLQAPVTSTPNIPIEPSGAIDLPPATPPEKIEVERPKRRWLKWFMIFFSLLIVLAIAAVAAGYFWYKDALDPVSGSQEKIELQVASGASIEQVATSLEEKKLVKSAVATQLYIRISGKGDIKAGHYVFTPSQGPAEIIDWLNQGRVDTFKVTILPGKTLAEIKKKLQEDGFSADEIDTAFAKQYNHPLLADKPAGTTLEGYIFPETYFMSSDTSLEKIITQGLDLFQKQIDEKALKPALAQKNLSLYQAITLGSIVEKEVSNASDKRQVAQVFLKRLAEGAGLHSDPTYKYAAALLGVPPSTAIDSPYNTYKITGLPPGPIANMSIDSLEALANPAPGDYLYFVAGDDGSTHFSRTFAEHEQNIRQYCQKLCSTF